MSSQAIADAFDAHVGLFTLGGDIQYEGVEFSPMSGTPYLSARLAAYSRMNAGFGPDAVMQENGAYQVNVNRPAGEGRRPAGEVADALVAHFHRGLTLALPGNLTVIVEYATAAPAMSSGGWITVPVTVMWMATDP